MDVWLEWARGPVFRFALAFMILGLIRHLALTVWEIGRAVQRAGDRRIPYAKLARATLEWLFPFTRANERVVYSVTTVAFHVSIIVAPLLLGAHIELIRSGIGFGWPAIPNILADALTLIAIVTAVALIVQRVVARDSRGLSGFSDYALPLIVALPFVTGFLAARPTLSLFSYETTMFLHVMSANFVLVLIPITKLSHCALLPTTQIISEVAWHFTPNAGSRIAAALGKEDEAI